jgi:L-glyceraldehyde 3-phosphate reductase
VLIGASSVQQIDDNVEMLKNKEFTQEELQNIEAVLK